MCEYARGELIVLFVKEQKAYLIVFCASTVCDVLQGGSGEDIDDDGYRVEMVGRRRPCWLFGRKFTPRAGTRIARFSSVVMGF
mmetsp:Transcript_14266/g.23468  ORF Transcript_14266/g.23468 Transcript_14266/m.23468 type:complete len:83 (+) Transcript_14266:120-368(+)